MDLKSKVSNFVSLVLEVTLVPACLLFVTVVIK